MMRPKTGRNASSFVIFVLKNSFSVSFVVLLKNEKQNKYVGK